MLLALIAVCEASFWALLLAGLVVRYILRRPRAGAALLMCVPLVDLVLFSATVADLRAGATPDQAHGLAALYIGFSVAFGHSTIRWLDQRFAHRFAGGPPLATPPRAGSARMHYEWRLWLRTLLGATISCALLLGGAAIVGDAARAAVLFAWMARVALVVLIALIWPVSYMLWPAKPSQ